MRFSLSALLMSLIALQFSVGMIDTSSAAVITGNITYTRYGGGADRLKKVTVTYDNAIPSFTLGTPTVIAGTGNGMVGADGLAFDPFNSHILVGAQSSTVHRVNPVGPVVSSASTPGVAAFHLAVDPAGTHVYASGIPGGLSRVPIGASFGTAGTAFAISGSVSSISTLIFGPAGAAYFTNAPSGGIGNFGTVVLNTTLNTAVTTTLISSLPAAHGGVYDPFTGDIILFGDDHITQIDLTTNTVVSDLDLSAVGISVADLDQGTVDGLGHLYAADNGGKLIFVDYASSGLVAAAGNFRASPFLDTFLDDVAPLVGPGSVTNPVPEPASLISWALGFLAIVGFRRFRKNVTELQIG